jgi:uncharacterized protein YqcC (DUF446 family)
MGVSLTTAVIGRIQLAASYDVVGEKIVEIEAEMKRIGMWQEEDLPPEGYEFTGPFGMDSMAGQQWLQFILIPRVREIIAQGGQFPESSEVSTWAVREFDGIYEAGDLVTKLYEFDRLFD